MRLCAVFKALLHKFVLRDSEVVVRETRKIVMPKVIAFYIPARFQRRLEAAPELQFGKVIEFCVETKESA